MKERFIFIVNDTMTGGTGCFMMSFTMERTAFRLKFYLISDNIDTATGLRLAGIEGVVVHEDWEVESELRRAMADESVGINSRWMPVSPGVSGMQPRDPCRPWRGTLASGHKPR